jgi:flagellar basal-body rod protein FlgC
LSINPLFRPMSISASGMSAERLRMEIIANNLANAQSTRGPDGTPFRRQEVVFATAGRDARSMEGVRVTDVIDDPSPYQRVYMPGHPDADDSGHVLMPNVQLPVEMVNLMTAMRSYEANLKAAQAYRQMNEQALVLLRGS